MIQIKVYVNETIEKWSVAKGRDVLILN